MPNTAHAYEHVEGIYLPIAVGVFVLVLGALLVLLVLWRQTQDAGARSTSERGLRAKPAGRECRRGQSVRITSTASRDCPAGNERRRGGHRGGRYAHRLSTRALSAACSPVRDPELRSASSPSPTPQQRAARPPRRHASRRLEPPCGPTWAPALPARHRLRTQLRWPPRP